MKKIHYPRPHFERDGFFMTDPESSTFVFPDHFKGDIILMNCEGRGSVCLNGEKIQAAKGTDVTSLVRREGENSIFTEGEVSCVWFECVPKIYIKRAKLIPNADENKVRVELELSGNTEAAVEIFAENSLIAAYSTRSASCEIPVPEYRMWTPDDPFMYDVMLTAGKDTVKTRFGMKKLSISRNEQHPRIYLNNKMYFPVAAEDTDIEAAKAAGFDMIKVSQRMSDEWYARCEKRGMMVWQDSYDEDVLCFTCIAVSRCEGADCLVCGDNGDIRVITGKMEKADGKALIFSCSKKRPSPFYKKSARLFKKGISGAVWEFCAAEKNMKDRAKTLRKTVYAKHKSKKSMP